MIHKPFVRHPVQMNGENMQWEKCWEKYWNEKKNLIFCLEYVILFILNILVHQNGENAKSKWSLFRRNSVTRKLMFCLCFSNRKLFFNFSSTNINMLE